MYSSSGNYKLNGLIAKPRCRSLSLEESGQADEPSPYESELEKEDKPRRRLNTYVSSKDSGLPAQRSLDEAGNEDADDGPFSLSYPSSSMPHSQSLIAKSELAFFNFLQRCPCYELMPHSSKLVCFDTRLSGRKAFFAMMHNSVSSAMLWSHEKQTFIGVLTVIDFIRAICHQFLDGGPVLEEQSVDSWLDEKRRITVIGPEESLTRATSLLLSSRIRRLPVCDPASGNILFTIAHKHVARFVYLNLQRLLKPRSWFRNLKDVGIGTFTNIATATPQTKIIDALQLLIDRHVSALPVVAATDGRLIGIFSRSDALVLSVDKAYMNLNRSLSDILPHLSEQSPRPPSLGPLRVCTKEETLGTIVERLVRGKVHRLVVVDSSRRVIGIVSLTDLLRFFVRAPPSTYLQTPGGTVTPVLTASSYDLSNTPSLDQLQRSHSLMSAPSPVACMSFANSNGFMVESTPPSQSSSLRLGTTFENQAAENAVSASLPPCPGPASQMAFTGISS